MQILKRYVIASALLDYFAALLAWLVFYYYRKYQIENVEYPLSAIFSDIRLIQGLVVIPIFWLFIYFTRYQKSIIRNKQVLNEVFATFSQTLLGVTILFFILLIDDNIRFIGDYYELLLALFTLHFFLTILVRLAILNKYNKDIRNGKIYYNTLIIGEEKKITEVIQELNSINRGNKIVGYISSKPIDNNNYNYLDNEFHENIIDKYYIQEIVIAYENIETKNIIELVEKLQSKDLVIKSIPDVYAILYGSVRINSLDSPMLIEIETQLLKPWEKVVKTCFDYIISLCIIVFISPLILIIIAVLKLKEPKKIIYKQERIGHNGKPFMMYKFKTMKEDAEINGPQLSTNDDTRITCFGRYLRKYRLDELPNLYNVLKGDMSLVGPRPERAYYIEKIISVAPEFLYLQKVKPGITSWGMVRYGYASSIEEMVKRMKYDLLYIENLSIFLDLKILLYTIWIVLQGRGK